MKNLLLGKKLTVLSIHKDGLFGDSIVTCCDNCGRVIINTAKVVCSEGVNYTIGLDCKKSLIDKPKVDEIMASNKWNSKHEAKVYKAEQNLIERFLTIIGRENITIESDGKDITLIDYTKPNRYFSEYNGLTEFSESYAYLKKIGLGDFIQDLHTKGKIKRV